MADAWLYRFATGLALAGIYPPGMKLVVSWAPQRAGEALGWLVGMLTFGTALPHAVRATSGQYREIPLRWDPVLVPGVAGYVVESALAEDEEQRLQREELGLHRLRQAA